MSVMLTSSMRANLSALQNTATLMGTTQERLATGKRVNSAIDDPTAYFSAKQGHESANNLDNLKAAMAEGLQTIKSATTAIDSAVSVLTQMKALVNQAKATTIQSEKTEYAKQYNDLQSQLKTMMSTDIGYKGTNLLKGDALKLQLAETATSSINIAGQNVSGAAYIGASVATSGAAIDAAGSAMDGAISKMRGLAKTLSSSAAYVQTRMDFASSMSSILKTGADNLVAADTNSEAATMLALQTQNTLGVSSLSMSNQSSQAILRLF